MVPQVVDIGVIDGFLVNGKLYFSGLCASKTVFLDLFVNQKFFQSRVKFSQQVSPLLSTKIVISSAYANTFTEYPFSNFTAVNV